MQQFHVDEQDHQHKDGNLYNPKNINANYKITSVIPEEEIIKFSKNHKIDFLSDLITHIVSNRIRYL